MDVKREDIAGVLEALQSRDYALLELPVAPDTRQSAAEALRERKSWQPEFPELEHDTMGRTYLQNKVSWLGEAEENLGEICRALNVLAELTATRIMAHGVSTEDDKKQLALPAQGIRVEASDRLLFRDQRKVCIMHFVGGSEGTLTLHREGSEDLQVDCKDGLTLIFRHDVLDYSSALETFSSSPAPRVKDPKSTEA
eukprot:s2573_g2.t1